MEVKVLVSLPADSSSPFLNRGYNHFLILCASFNFVESIPILVCVLSKAFFGCFLKTEEGIDVFFLFLARDESAEEREPRVPSKLEWICSGAF